MDLSGAFSNPFVTDKDLLVRLSDLRRSLLGSAVLAPRQARSAPSKPDPVLTTVTRVLELSGRPMRANEIHAAACDLLGRPLRWSSVKGLLSAYTIGGDRRFRRVRHGVYEL